MAGKNKNESCRVKKQYIDWGITIAVTQ